jgi:hypothetical protein
MSPTPPSKKVAGLQQQKQTKIIKIIKIIKK